MHSRIFIIGFMGSGKTTHGKLLAKNLGFRFFDLDQWIENQYELTVAEIFAQRGEEAFRQMETEAIKSLSKEKEVVISTGGGAPCHNDNMELLLSSGLTVYLKLTPEALVSRLTNSKTKRPLLAGKRKEELVPLIELMLAARVQYYEKANVIIDGFENVEERLLAVVKG
ncbi:shikimate kinase [Bacteroidota bacterium]